jgi:mRNA interferase MazF
MATRPTRGDVWLVDLGMVAKVRPCLVLSVPADDENDRVLTTVVPHTTAARYSRFEVRSSVRFLKPGAFDAQNIITIPRVKLVRRVGTLPDSQMTDVVRAVRTWLGFDSGS